MGSLLSHPLYLIWRLPKSPLSSTSSSIQHLTDLPSKQSPIYPTMTDVAEWVIFCVIRSFLKGRWYLLEKVTEILGYPWARNLLSLSPCAWQQALHHRAFLFLMFDEEPSTVCLYRAVILLWNTGWRNCRFIPFLYKPLSQGIRYPEVR